MKARISHALESRQNMFVALEKTETSPAAAETPCPLERHKGHLDLVVDVDDDDADSSGVCRQS